MEGDPFTLDRGHAHRRTGGRRTEGFVYIRSEYPDAVATIGSCASRPPTSSAGSAPRPWVPTPPFDLSVRVGAGCVHLRRGDRDAREPRGQARRGAGQATVAGHRGALRSADGRQQRADARDRPGDHRPGRRPPTRRSASGRSRGTQVFQLAGNVARGGIVETAVRRDPRRAGGRLRRRARQRPPGARRAGRRAARGRICPRRRSTSRWTTRSFAAADGARRARRRSSCSTTRSIWRDRPGSRWSSAPRSRAGSARRAASGRSGASS